MDQLIFVFALMSMPSNQPGCLNNQAEALVVSSYHRHLRELAVSAELIDPREMKYMFKDSTTPQTICGAYAVDGEMVYQYDVLADLNNLRNRVKDLGDAPALADAQRFPSRTALSEWLAQNRAYKNLVEAQHDLLPWQHRWVTAFKVRENDKLYKILDCARDAQIEYFYITVRRAALKRLRDDLIGAEDYYAGRLPPAVPVWLFQELK